MQINFIIQGNPENLHGNPMPYTRLPNNMKFSPLGERYARWKRYVLSTFWTEAHKFPEAQEMIDFRTGQISVPKKNQVAITVHVKFVNHSHGDLDNIVKGILDAIIKNDKCVNEIHATSEFSPTDGGTTKVELKIL
jgi:Holliday junction resolvase RusA-like endonuclease